jgi:hypothetical protein
MQVNQMKFPYKTRGCTKFGMCSNFVQSYTYNQEDTEKVTCNKGRRISISSVLYDTTGLCKPAVVDRTHTQMGDVKEKAVL